MRVNEWTAGDGDEELSRNVRTVRNTTPQCWEKHSPMGKAHDFLLLLNDIERVTAIPKSCVRSELTH